MKKKSWLFSFSLVCGLCTVCHGLFALPLGVIGKLWYVIEAISGHLFKLLFLFDSVLEDY